MLLTRSFTFDAAHNLQDYKGKCERLHGHTWRAEVTLSGPVRSDGLVYDFVDLGEIIDERVLRELDHSYLNEHVAQPSAEHIALWIWERLADLPLAEVRVWESESCFVTYRGEPEPEATSYRPGGFRPKEPGP